MAESVTRWAGVALALRRPPDDRLASRLATYLHPLAGRTLTWHTFRALSAGASKPQQLLLVSADPTLSGSLEEHRFETVVPARGAGWAAGVAEQLHPSAERLLIVDAAAAALADSLTRLLRGPTPRALLDADGQPIAVWLERQWFAERAADAPDLERLAADSEPLRDDAATDAFVVRDRATLARATQLIRSRTVLKLMQRGVTFLMPETVWADVDVEIGADTVVYPGVILEGRTTVGEASVIGPGCRIVDSQLGSGVELRGWNYVVNTFIRNHAVLEPYVRRGYD